MMWSNLQSPLDILICALHGALAATENQVHLSLDQVALILQHFQHQQDTIDKLLQQEQQNKSNKAKTPDYYNIAKYEDIICKGIKPPHDGSSEHLIPFLNCIDIRQQDESWYPPSIVTIGTNPFDLTR